MAYNLRPRSLAEALRDAEENENEENIDGEDSESKDNVSIDTEESDYQNDSDYENETDSDVEMINDADDAARDQRLLASRARGRPVNTLRG